MKKCIYPILCAVILISLSLVSCDLSGAKGTLSVTLGSNMARDLLPVVDLDIARYVLTGTNPSAASFTQTYTSPGVYTIENLLAGDWTITADAYNAEDERIGTCQKTVTIEKKETTSTAMTIIPLAGNGTFSFEMTWPDLGIVSPSITGTITNVSNDTTAFSMTINDTTSASFSTSLPNGYYTFDLVMKSGSDVIWQHNPEAFRIVTEKTTSGTLDLIGSDLAGDIEISIGVDMQNPLNISLSPSATTITTSDSITIAGTVDRTPDTWRWYLDGSIVSENSGSVTLGPSLSKGKHCVTLIAKKDDVLGSADCSFEVTEEVSSIAEDFNDGIAQGWTMDSLYWQLQNNVLERYGLGGNDWKNAYYATNPFDGAFTYQADFAMITGSTSKAKGLFINSASPTLVGNFECYMFCMAGGLSSGYSYWVGKLSDDGSTEYWTGWLSYASTASTVTMKIVTDGAGAYYCYLNRDLVYSWFDTSLSSGYIGLAGYDGGVYICDIDNVYLTKNPDTFKYPVSAIFSPMKAYQPGISPAISHR